jgi:hypothetical protein
MRMGADADVFFAVMSPRVAAGIGARCFAA